MDPKNTERNDVRTLRREEQAVSVGSGDGDS